MGEGACAAAGAVDAVAFAVALAMLAGVAVGVTGAAPEDAAVPTGGAEGTASPLAPHPAANSAIADAHAREKFPRVDGSWRTPPYNRSLMARVPSRDSSVPAEHGSGVRPEQPLESGSPAEQPQPLSGLDPWARERIERAVAPYLASLSSADLDWMRAQLALAMEDDPEVSATVRAARGASAEVSGTVRRGDGGSER
jgi:hypothetical protein